ncbi:hypothetical protein [Xanthomonas phage RTH11]|nr:hypothetical protein [Xanthomonas phage RTH11]
MNENTKSTIKSIAKNVGIFAASFTVTYLVIKGVQKVAEQMSGEVIILEPVAGVSEVIVDAVG